VAVTYAIRALIDQGLTTKLNASQVGGARIITIAKGHLTLYGPSGVPKGGVEAQNLGKGIISY
jgi:hypothetical protein